MSYFDAENFKKYFPSMQEWVNYGCDIAWDDYTLLRNHGDYIQIMFPSSSPKGHDTYDMYFDASGQLDHVTGHPQNAGFTGTKYYYR